MYKNKFGPTPKWSLASTLPSTQPGFICIGGPCSIENEDQVIRIFNHINDYVTHFRGGVFRAGTYPGDNWGWQMELLKFYSQFSKQKGKPNIVDVLDVRDLEKIEPYSSVFQVGTRQSQHYALLRELGQQKKPVILKRGTHQTLGEFMGSLEYILRGGNSNVILCERGSVSYLDHCRWELSISMIATLKHMTRMPVVVDASHGTGNRQIVKQMTLAGVAAGADGILVETHYSPDESMSDAEQAVSLSEFCEIADKSIQLRSVLQSITPPTKGGFLADYL